MMDKGYTVIEANWAEHSKAIQAIRYTVFVIEQAVPESEEWDEHDDSKGTVHFLALDDQGRACGTIRLVNTAQNKFKVTRLAVSKEYRNKGIASALVSAVTKKALSQGTQDIYLHAQVNASKLYKKFSYNEASDIFLEAGIEHVKMVFDRSSPGAYEKIFNNEVLRLNYVGQYITHSVNIIACGSRTIDICSKNLRDDLFTQELFLDALSAFARSDKRAKVRILVHSANSLGRRSQTLIELTRRLSSKIQLKTLDPDCNELPRSFICSDARRLVYFNNEDQLEGFCCYQASPEAESILNEFEHAWNHLSNDDPNLATLNI